MFRAMATDTSPSLIYQTKSAFYIACYTYGILCLKDKVSRPKAQFEGIPILNNGGER